jgi:2-hydroxy-6-oxonona-2,4-dienedioate hydrolase
MTLGDERWFARIAPNGDPSLPPIVMVHGLIVSGTYFRPVADLLDERYTIYVPDLPGSGRSTGSKRWTLPTATHQLAGWMDAHDLTGVIVVGNSLGCQVATLLATTRPDLVRSLVLIGPTHDPAITTLARLLKRSMRDIPLERPSIWSVWIPDFFGTGLRQAWSQLREMFADDQLSRLGEVTQPAFVVGGERDPIVPQSWVRDVASRRPRGEAIIVPDAPHALNFSSAADLVAAIDRAIGFPAEPDEDEST